jgi:hypothetical protein
MEAHFLNGLVIRTNEKFSSVNAAISDSFPNRSFIAVSLG